MKKTAVILLMLSLGPYLSVQAGPPPEKVFRPYFLSLQNKIPNTGLESPGGMIWGPDKKTLELRENTGAPDISTLRQLTFPDLFIALKQLKHTERSIGTFYWHQAGGLDYCHFPDREGNHWYGWISGGNFNWVLWRGRRFWWRDAFTGHWLYYYQGYWWRADRQDGQSLQVLVDGEYFLCDRQGKILKDMGQDGEGAIVSAPGRYQGDFHRGSHGGHHENHSQAPSSDQAPTNSKSSSTGNQ